MAPSVMVLDVLKLRRLFKRRLVPVQVAHPLVQSRISRANVPNVAFEMLDVDWIEAN